ncbi:uncharacterized protein [Leptinotarsa decemlineata]|uniref:uncharacterized protein n=1 Tax=Leptinotarsa decemlineata TaxID=7539 RepID=UPI003D307DF4
MRLFVIYISVLLLGKLFGARLDILKRPKSFCGSKLTRIMAQFCLMYPSFPEHRQKRQIATECCHNKCSLDYLLDNYCGTVDTDALEQFRLASENSEEFSPPPKIRDRRRSSLHGQTGSTEENGFKSRSNGRRGKRNCTCKKHKGKRESKRREILSRRRNSVPAARIGLIENYQEPFYASKIDK